MISTPNLLTAITVVAVITSLVLISLSYKKLSDNSPSPQKNIIQSGFQYGGSKPGSRCSPKGECRRGLKCNIDTMLCETP